MWKSNILNYLSLRSQHSYSHCMHSNRNSYKCSNWKLAKIFIRFHGLKGELIIQCSTRQSHSPTNQLFSLTDKMVLMKEVVVIILFFILWIYSIFLFYRWSHVFFISTNVQMQTKSFNTNTKFKAVDINNCF